MGVRLKGDWQDLHRHLHRLSGGVPEAVKRAVAEGIHARTQRRFEESRGPDGRPWPPLSPATLEKEVRPRDRLKRGGISAAAQRRVALRKPLVRTGRLKASIGWKVSGNAIAVGTNLVYAAIHQFGGKAGRGRKVRVPARPFLGLTEEDRKEAEALLLEWLSRR
ncbi:phage virion morphogenesis protein [Thermus sp. PS18]|uniref:phage virion morphogenesis protein n=1 Tax=Thermus sp. PS18 TaxID=2849039 RepID=UPI0022653CD8|nr:phage virion morphogenesis protein [Thermus sp. PS18]UZX15034.1 phage virion morphogenesis protein [Thermus sp. PS18]